MAIMTRKYSRSSHIIRSGVFQYKDFHLKVNSWKSMGVVVVVDVAERFRSRTLGRPSSAGGASLPLACERP